MADQLDLAPVVTPVSVAPQEALEYFRSKGFAPPDSRFSYRDWWGASHARGFVVAKAMQDDILQDIRGALDQALSEGRTMEQFRDEIEPVLRRKGWWGRRTLTDPLTGETRVVQLGSARRLQVIFDTNMRTAYAAGRWVRIQRTKDALPYLQYIQLQRVEAREAHRPFHEMVVPVDHPWWATHFPPNGYFCACLTRQLSGAAVKRRKLTVTTDPPADTVPWTDNRSGRVVDVPTGITPGFESNPGAAFLADRARHDRVAGDLTPEARGVELGLVNEARARGLRTGAEHLAAVDLDPDRPSAEGGVEDVAAIGWVSGDPGEVAPDDALSAAMADPNRRIGVVRNHPSPTGLSEHDLTSLGREPGLVRIMAVGHDGSLYRAANPRPGLGDIAQALYEMADTLVGEAAADTGLDQSAVRRLVAHASSSALDRADYLDYAHAISGGGRLTFDRFGAQAMDGIIARLVQWLVQWLDQQS
ncbi:phage minor head protein [Tateyamaria sp.]|uniref:phage head morphogenesis protein n=2 Tax=Tateyamaria sp. TaxID=1929288 RepID=UPI003B225FB2